MDDKSKEVIDSQEMLNLVEGLGKVVPNILGEVFKTISDGMTSLQEIKSMRRGSPITNEESEEN